jgi:hypothetical protein
MPWETGGCVRLEIASAKLGLCVVAAEHHECRRMKQAGRVWKGVNRQGRGNGVGGTQRVWKPVLVDLPDLKC